MKSYASFMVGMFCILISGLGISGAYQEHSKFDELARSYAVATGKVVDTVRSFGKFDQSRFTVQFQTRDGRTVRNQYAGTPSGDVGHLLLCYCTHNPNNSQLGSTPQFNTPLYCGSLLGSFLFLCLAGVMIKFGLFE
jgi:hypothetical protein